MIQVISPAMEFCIKGNTFIKHSEFSTFCRILGGVYDSDRKFYNQTCFSPLILQIPPSFSNKGSQKLHKIPVAGIFHKTVRRW